MQIHTVAIKVLVLPSKPRLKSKTDDAKAENEIANHLFLCAFIMKKNKNVIDEID